MSIYLASFESINQDCLATWTRMLFDAVQENALKKCEVRLACTHKTKVFIYPSHVVVVGQVCVEVNFVVGLSHIARVRPNFNCVTRTGKESLVTKVTCKVVIKTTIFTTKP